MKRFKRYLAVDIRNILSTRISETEILTQNTDSKHCPLQNLLLRIIWIRTQVYVIFDFLQCLHVIPSSFVNRPCPVSSAKWILSEHSTIPSCTEGTSVRLNCATEINLFYYIALKFIDTKLR
jgi:hypothetical protein